MCLMPGARTFLLCRSCSITLPGFCWMLAACHLPKCCATTRGIFGQRLEDTVQYEKKYGKHLAPLLVEQCVDFIREHGLTEEGLFRMPGQANLVKDLQDSFDCGEKPLFDSNTDIHTVASPLKLYLRELPEPVIPFARYKDFLSCGQLLSKDKGEGTQELANHVKCLPQANYNLLKYVCKTQMHSQKMGENRKWLITEEWIR
ncbi:rho GTPase-activating protein 22 isoform X1 [Rhineura floridana]|uniref:rho GTPase-activating protein 22 isoform X1 n=1 Tax=Rhineura floridana TaxID=261503 RepID=UPI002AC82218|nr:rho GTPase-activating protein 22 isoform X1 [Rhineura floridana]